MTDRALDIQGRILWLTSLFAAALGIVSYSASWIPGVGIAFALGFVVFVWGLILADEEGRRNYGAWEKKYAAMSDERKIEYHLDRARHYGSNVDANIAQAIIERNKTNA